MGLFLGLTRPVLVYLLLVRHTVATTTATASPLFVRRCPLTVDITNFNSFLPIGAWYLCAVPTLYNCM